MTASVSNATAIQGKWLLLQIFVKILLIVFLTHIQCLFSVPRMLILPSVIFFCGGFAFLVYVHWDAKHLACRHV